MSLFTAEWDPSAIGLMDAQVVEHIWRLELPGLDPSVSNVPAWDIQVTLDGGQSPYGRATFKAPVEYITETGDAEVFYPLTPYTLPIVRIYAGWRHVVDGYLTDDIHILFAGYITGRKLIVEEGLSHVQFTAQSAEVLYEFPSNRAYTVLGSHTSVPQTVGAVNASGTPFYRTVNIAADPAGLTAPTAPQLAAFRTTEIEVDDDVMDFVRTCASTLNQWVRGDIRAAGTPYLLISDDPYPYVSSQGLNFTKIERTDDVDQWANILKLTVQWGDPVTTKRKTILGAGVTGGTGAVRARDVTLNIKPPGGNIPAGWALSTKWLRRVQDMAEVFYVATGRAVWWLQPRLWSTFALGLAYLNDQPGPIETITFDVDAGQMTVSWSASNFRP